MRLASGIAVAASVALGCAAALPDLRPADASQAAHGDEAQVAVAGVKLAVRAGGWRGWPDDLQAHLTPVEVAISNGSPGPLRVRPELFAIVLPDGRRLTALPPGDLARILRSYRDMPATLGVHTGWYGRYPWPGTYEPFGGPYPYVWGGLRGPGPVYPPVDTSGSVPPPDQRPIPRGTLEQGGYVSLMLFFDAPADRLHGFTFEAALESGSGAQLGVARVPFTR